MSAITIRDETEVDYAAIDRINDLAFKETAQSQIIRELRKTTDALWSQVLLKNGDIIGHLMFYKVWLNGDLITAGLGPLSILPQYQRQGYGGDLIHSGLKKCDPMQHQIIFLLGHTEYYPRFGFSSELGAQYKSPWPRPAFMGLSLNPNAPISGTLTFPQAYL